MGNKMAGCETHKKPMAAQFVTIPNTPGSAITAFSVGTETGFSRVIASHCLIEAFNHHRAQLDECKANGDHGFWKFVSSFTCLYFTYDYVPSVEDLVYRSIATRIRATLTQRPNVLQLGHGMNAIADEKRPTSSKSKRELMTEALTQYNKDVDGSKGLLKLSSDERSAVRSCCMCSDKFRSLIKEHYNRFKVEKSALPTVVLSKEMFVPGTKPAVTYKKEDNDYWYTTLTGTDEASELWLLRLITHFLRQVDIAVAKKRSIHTRPAVASFRYPDPAALMSICCTWSVWVTEMEASGIPPEHREHIQTRFLTGLLDKSITELIVCASPKQSWRNVEFIDGYLRDNGLHKYTCLPGASRAHKDSGSVEELRALEKELESRFHTMVVRWNHDTTEWSTCPRVLFRL